MEKHCGRNFVRMLEGLASGRSTTESEGKRWGKRKAWEGLEDVLQGGGANVAAQRRRELLRARNMLSITVWEGNLLSSYNRTQGRAMCVTL